MGVRACKLPLFLYTASCLLEKLEVQQPFFLQPPLNYDAFYNTYIIIV